jgi:hypothetical protein
VQPECAIGLELIGRGEPRDPIARAKMAAWHRFPRSPAEYNGGATAKGQTTPSGGDAQPRAAKGATEQ